MRNSIKELLKSAFIVIIFLTLFTTIFFYVKQNSLSLETQLSEYSKNFKEYSKKEIPETSGVFIPQTNWSSNDTVWSQPLQLTHPDIKRDEYKVLRLTDSDRKTDFI